MKSKKIMMLAAVLLTALGLPATAQADPLSLTLSPTSVSGSPTALFTFGGTLSNAAPPTVFLNSINVLLSGSHTAFVVDTGPFFDNTPTSLIGGQSVSVGTLFTVTIEPGTLMGLYSGTVTIIGGGNENAQNPLGMANFSITVQPIPEPTTIMLLGTGLTGAAAAIRRGRKSWQKR